MSFTIAPSSRLSYTMMTDSDSDLLFELDQDPLGDMEVVYFELDVSNS